MNTLGDEHLPVPARRTNGHQGGFSYGAATFVEAGVGHVHAGELADERLKLEERLERSLARLGLVGRVGSVELTAAGDRVHDGGDEMVVATGAEEADGV